MEMMCVTGRKTKSEIKACCKIFRGEFSLALRAGRAAALAAIKYDEVRRNYAAAMNAAAERAREAERALADAIRSIRDEKMGADVPEEKKEKIFTWHYALIDEAKIEARRKELRLAQQIDYTNAIYGMNLAVNIEYDYLRRIKDKNYDSDTEKYVSYYMADTRIISTTQNLAEARVALFLAKYLSPEEAQTRKAGRACDDACYQATNQWAAMEKTIGRSVDKYWLPAAGCCVNDLWKHRSLGPECPVCGTPHDDLDD
jgi:hypothetical protein